MVELLFGAILGGCAMIAKDKILGKETNMSNHLSNELNSLNDENEKLRRRYKEAERQIEDLLVENKNRRKQAKATDNNLDDLEDELDSLKTQIKRLTVRNDELLRKISEYKMICDNYESEILELKNK